jgi:uncharacterized protein (UPF0305 family)
MNFIKKLIFIISSNIVTVLLPMSESLVNHKLPNGPIRTKLDTIFRSSSSDSSCIQNITTDSSWCPNSNFWCWLSGSLKTAAGSPFGIRMTKYPAGVPIYHPQDPTFIRTTTPQQNLSCIKKADEVNAVIRQKSITTCRVPNIWVYPISGNDSDLSNSNITDREVVIVQEVVNANPESLRSYPKFNDIMIQHSLFQMTLKEYDDLVTIAREAKVLLGLPRLQRDHQGIINLINLEDTIASKRVEAEKSNALTRPFKLYKFKYFEENCILSCIGFTGALQDSINNNLELHAKVGGLYLESCSIFIKQQAPTLIAITALIAALVIRHKKHVAHVKQLIEKCRNEIKQKLTTANTIDIQVFLDAATQTLRIVAPHEKRPEIIDAFATLVYAELNDLKSDFVILNKPYATSQEAITISLKLIEKTWYADHSLQSKTNNIFKALGNEIRKLPTFLERFYKTHSTNVSSELSTVQ